MPEFLTELVQRAPNLRVVQTVILGNGGFVPCRKQEVSKQSREQSEKTLSTHFPETLRRLPRLFPRLFGDSSGLFGAGGPGDIFETFLAFRAQRARETSPL